MFFHPPVFFTPLPPSTSPPPPFLSLSLLSPSPSSSPQLLAVVISNFSAEEKEKFRKLFLHKREALRHAFRVLTGPTGITFEDFLAFMQDYRPRMRESAL